MRIISGKFKGQLLVSFNAGHIRPTTDRVKETLFNKIMFEIEGTRVLDLFCGTGNLGLEALSRGAVHCTFVDAHKGSIQITRDNIKKLKIEKEDFICIQKDVLNYLRTYEGEPFDIIFADPPFTEKMAHDVMVAISQSRALGDQTLVMIESEKRERMDEKYETSKPGVAGSNVTNVATGATDQVGNPAGILVQHSKKDFGDKYLSFFRKAEESES